MITTSSVFEKLIQAWLFEKGEKYED